MFKRIQNIEYLYHKRNSFPYLIQMQYNKIKNFKEKNKK